MSHRYVENRIGFPGDTKIVALDQLKLRGRPIGADGLDPGESATLTVYRASGETYLDQIPATWQMIYESGDGHQYFAWAVDVALPMVETAEDLLLIWTVDLGEADRTFVDRIRVLADPRP